MSSGVWVSESAPDGEGELPMVEAISKLRDEVTVVLMSRHMGNNRSLSFVLAKLDEARHWAIDYGEGIGARVVTDRAGLLKRLAEERARDTDTTVTTGNGKETPSV